MKLSEVIAEIESGSKKTYMVNNGYNSKSELSVDKNGYLYFNKYSANMLMSAHTDGGGFNGNLYINSNWKLAPQYVTWQEALSAFSEGSVVGYELDGFRHRLTENEIFLTPNKLIKGKWWIE